jgi:hypothetical protein
MTTVVGADMKLVAVKAVKRRKAGRKTVDRVVEDAQVRSLRAAVSKAAGLTKERNLSDDGTMDWSKSQTRTILIPVTWLTQSVAK